MPNPKFSLKINDFVSVEVGGKLLAKTLVLKQIPTVGNPFWVFATQANEPIQVSPGSVVVRRVPSSWGPDVKLPDDLFE